MADKELFILTVCGVGMGSSLVLRMYVEDVLKEMGLKARVEATEVSMAAGSGADIIMASPTLMEVLQGAAPTVIPIFNFTDTKEIRAKLEEYLAGRNPS
ncbi:MAG: PTS sugar transporter subunit IIB [Symbiobacterium sp.]|uniref:PTS sugar transporter subunit IIB n=1 Tax=Symbiobacterium sp. TaxID=1971213 RepID=UPI003464E72F